MGKISACLLQEGLITLGQLADEEIRVAHMRRSLYLLHISFHIGVLDVGLHRIGKQHGILQHDCRVATQFIPADIPNVHAVNEDLAGIDIVEPHQQVYHSGLTAAGGANQRHLFAGLYIQRKVMQHTFFRHIRKVYVAEADLAPGMLHIEAAAAVFRGMIHQFKDALRACNGSLHRTVQLRDLVDGAGKLLGIDDKCRNDTHRDQTLQGKIAAECRHDDEADVGDAIHNGAHTAAQDLSTNADLSQFIGGFVKGILHRLLLIVGYDGFITGDHFFGMAVQATQHLAASTVDPTHDAGKLFGHQHSQHHSEHGHQCQLPAIPQHNCHGAYHRQYTGNQVTQTLRHRHGDIFHVVGHTAHNVAVGVGIHILDGQPHDLFKQILSQPTHDILAEECRDQRLTKGTHHIDGNDCQHCCNQARHFCPFPLGNTVDDLTLQRRETQAHYRDQRHRKDHQVQQALFLAKILQKSQQGCLGALGFFRNHCHSGTFSMSGAALSGALMFGHVIKGIAVGGVTKAARQGLFIVFHLLHRSSSSFS